MKSRKLISIFLFYNKDLEYIVRLQMFCLSKGGLLEPEFSAGLCQCS